MKKTTLAVMLGAAVILVASGVRVFADDQKMDASQPAAATAATATPTPPDKIVFDKTAKMPPVTFPHAAHIKNFACKECHGGDKPLFPQKKDKDQPGMKMADFYAGKQCGSCHDGKKTVNGKPDGKPIFASKAGCMKCHKK